MESLKSQFIAAQQQFVIAEIETGVKLAKEALNATEDVKKRKLKKSRQLYETVLLFMDGGITCDPDAKERIEEGILSLHALLLMLGEDLAAPAEEA